MKGNTKRRLADAKFFCEFLLMNASSGRNFPGLNHLLEEASNLISEALYDQTVHTIKLSNIQYLIFQM